MRKNIPLVFAVSFFWNVGFAASWTGRSSSVWGTNANWLSNSPPSGSSAVISFPNDATGYNVFYESNVGGLDIASMTITQPSNHNYVIAGGNTTLIPLKANATISISAASGSTTAPSLDYYSIAGNTFISMNYSHSSFHTQLNYFSGAGGLSLTTPSGNLSGYYLADNTYTGTTTIAMGSGTVQCFSANVINGPLSLQNTGTLDLYGSNQSISRITTISGTTIQNSSRTANLTITDVSTINGTININGSVIIDTSGATVTLGSANTIGSGVALTAGTVAIGNNGALGTNTLSMSSGTTLQASATISDFENPISIPDSASVTIDTYDQSVTFSSFPDQISGGASTTIYFNQLGGIGTLTIPSANSSFSGTSAIVGGTVAIGDNGSLGSGEIQIGYGVLQASGDLTDLSNDILVTTLDMGSGSILDANGYTITLSSTAGQIAGSESLALNGMTGGTVTLLAANSGFTGDVALNDGTLVFGSASATIGSGTLTLSDGSTLSSTVDGVSIANAMILTNDATFNIATDTTTTLTSGFSGGNTLTLNGGKLKLDTMSTNSATTVNAASGELAVLGSLASDVAVGAGSTLSGTGTITGTVTIAGTSGNPAMYAPGASPGMQHMSGPVIFGPNVTYSELVDPSYVNQLIVTGSGADEVTINADSTFYVNLDASSSSYILPYEYPTPVISAPNSDILVIDPFTVLTSSPLISAHLIYTTTGIYLTLDVPNRLAGFTTTGNAERVAEALDTVYAEGTAALNQIFQSFLTLDPSEYDAALDQMQPALYKGALITQENNAVVVRRNLTERFQTLLDTQRCSMDPCCSHPCECTDTKWQLWMSGVGDFLHQQSVTFFNSPQAAYRDRTGGAIFGCDYNFQDTFYLGALAAYTASRVKWEDSQGLAHLNSGYAGLYFSLIGNTFYGNIAAIGAWSHFKEERQIAYPGVSLVAKNSHNGSQLLCHADTGVNVSFFWIPGTTFRIFDSLDWMIQREGGYTETRAGEWNLKVSHTHADMLRNELGIGFAGCRCFCEWIGTLDVKLGWVREARMSGKKTRAAFIGTDVPFTVIGYFPSRNLISPGVSLSFSRPETQFVCTIYYDGSFASHYSDNNFGVQISFGF